MKSVGLRELKNNLSRYVRKVRTGETLAITDRGEVIAELTPPRQDHARSMLETLARRGELILAKPLSRRDRSVLYRSRPPVLKDITSGQLLDEDRGER